MSGPLATVVVATHNRAHLLPRLLAALDAQDLDGEFEAVVVDDASTDDTPAVLTALAERYQFLRSLRQDVNTGPAAARNRGWRAGGAPLVAFTDDDCVPQPGWLRGLVEALDGADLVQGMTLPDPAEADRRGPFARTIEVRDELGYYQTCNMGYHRSALESVGGFDERFKRPSGEDTDLAWRLKEDGASSAFAAAAVVHHDVRPSNLLVHLKDTWRWGDCVLAVREHPQLRDLLYRRYFFRATHPKAVLAAVGLGLAAAQVDDARTVAAGLLLVAPYVEMRVRSHPMRGGPRRRLAVIPAALAADLVEVGVMAIASARYRSLVL